MRSAKNAVQMIFGASVEKEQKMRACVVTRPVGENGDYVAVRVTFQIIVWDRERKVTRAGSLTDPKIYQEFFYKLSKAVFLEAQEI
jgi:hypothetical protein